MLFRLCSGFSPGVTPSNRLEKEVDSNAVISQSTNWVSRSSTTTVGNFYET
ncbi:unnamed protein product [Arabidopsis lyrata]|nr:unnamed protein product [Arabidopsis lyrata]